MRGGGAATARGRRPAPRRKTRCGRAPAARRYGQQLRASGKKGGVIGCAMANRANKIAYALVRDQSGYDPGRWA